jgi:ADP-ribose pyrophosphatase YjhB (NUDIX family)
MESYAGILVKCNDKVLLCKRCADCTLGGQWSMPCGHGEGNENMKITATREFFEETNIKLRVNSVSLVDFFPSRTGKGLVYVYLYESKEEIFPDLVNAKDGREHSECGYYSINELDELTLSPEMKKIIIKVLS